MWHPGVCGCGYPAYSSGCALRIPRGLELDRGRVRRLERRLVEHLRPPETELVAVRQAAPALDQLAVHVGAVRREAVVHHHPGVGEALELAVKARDVLVPGQHQVHAHPPPDRDRVPVVEQRHHPLAIRAVVVDQIGTAEAAGLDDLGGVGFRNLHSPDYPFSLTSTTSRASPTSLDALTVTFAFPRSPAIARSILRAKSSSSFSSIPASADSFEVFDLKRSPPAFPFAATRSSQGALHDALTASRFAACFASAATMPPDVDLPCHAGAGRTLETIACFTSAAVAWGRIPNRIAATPATVGA